MKIQCKKIIDADSFCIPKLVMEIQGTHHRKLTKLEAFVLSVLVYFKDLKYDADSNRTIGTTVELFFGLTSIHEVLDVVIGSLIKKEYLSISPIPNGAYHTVLLNDVTILRPDDVFYDKQNLLTRVSVVPETGEYDGINIKDEITICKIDECDAIKKRQKQIVKRFCDRWNTDNTFFVEQSLECIGVKQDVIQEVSKTDDDGVMIHENVGNQEKNI